MMEQQQKINMELKLKELLYSTINNNDFDMFERNKNNNHPILLGFNSINKFNPREYRKITIEKLNVFFYSAFRPYGYVNKKDINVYDVGFKIEYPDGEPKLEFEYVIGYKSKKINLPWYKKWLGFEYNEITYNFTYKLILGELKYILNDIEVEEIFSILKLKYENHFNKLEEEKNKITMLKLDSRLELYK